MKNEREEAINKAISFIKNCAYKGTAIKIELEGQFGREGRVRNCNICNGRGTLECNCKSDKCESCQNRGIVDCTSCEGRGVTAQARRQMRTEDVHQYILDHVSREAAESLVFARTYNDGSVDTEFTFTLMIDDVWHSLEFIRAFKSLEEAMGTKMGTDGAGMHIAILNSATGNYPGGNSLDSRRAENFKHTMTKLLPALYFLASPTYACRRLNYRPPKIEIYDKYGAISGSHGCFEYRIFETCYERPEAILDNLCVIANTLKYYHYRKINLPWFGKIGTFKFIDYGQGINRFYQTDVNYKALMEGVKVLKPSYKKISDLRKERNFKITLTKIKSEESYQDKIYAAEYRQKRENVEKNHSELISLANKEWEKILTSYPSADKKQWVMDYFSSHGVEYPQGTLKDYIKTKKEQFVGERTYSEIAI